MGKLQNGHYRTAAGSEMWISGDYGGISRVNFDWLEEGACCDCEAQPYEFDGMLSWHCEECGGGSAQLYPADPAACAWQRLAGESMNDKELLKAAARAAGIVFRHDVDDFCTATKWERCGLNDAELPARYWNPLTDDGDALRLAVKLELTINPYTRGVFVSRDEGEPVILDEWSLDRAKTTRRAIVRAAAALDSGHNAGAVR